MCIRDSEHGFVLVRSVAAIAYEVEPLDDGATLVVQSELVANEPRPAASDDPRAAAALESPLLGELCSAHENEAVLVHRTKGSGLRAAAAMDHLFEGPEGTRCDPAAAWEDLARLTVTARVEPGQSLKLTKFLAYGWSAGDPGQGPDRPRLRRPLLLGHRVLRPAGAHLHRARGLRRRPALAPRHARPGTRPRRAARPGRRRLPLAHDQRPGVLGLLAGRD